MEGEEIGSWENGEKKRRGSDHEMTLVVIIDSHHGTRWGPLRRYHICEEDSPVNMFPVNSELLCLQFVRISNLHSISSRILKNSPIDTTSKKDFDTVHAKPSQQGIPNIQNSMHSVRCKLAGNGRSWSITTF